MNRNRITIASSLVLALAACSDEANIGVDSQPVSCLDVGNAEVGGRVIAPAVDGGARREIEFGATTPSVTLGPAGTQTAYSLYLTASEIVLGIGFSCGAAELASYGVVDQGRDPLACPFQVTGYVSGQQIQYLGAKSGTLIVDDNANCLAGRFAIDFGDGGAIDGWFSSAWQ